MSTTGELAKLTPENLRATAKNLGINPTDFKANSDLMSAIEIAASKKQHELEIKAKAQIRHEAALKSGVDPDAPRRKAPEDVCLDSSPLKVVHFRNLEEPAEGGEPGADIAFTKGSQGFHLYDGHWYNLPECLVTEDPLSQTELIKTVTAFWQQAGLSPKMAKQQTIAVLKSISLPLECTTPVYDQVENKRTGEVTSEMVTTQPRFLFSIIRDSDKDAAIGTLADKPVKESQLV